MTLLTNVTVLAGTKVELKEVSFFSCGILITLSKIDELVIINFSWTQLPFFFLLYIL